jgi:thioesterase domain-containing protein
LKRPGSTTDFLEIIEYILRAKTVTPSELEEYLHEHIPLSSAMQVSVVEVSPEQIVLSAPLAPNINHRETVFGGSASAVALLAAWALLHTKLTAAGLKSTLVIRRNTMSYEQAIAGSFIAKASSPSSEAWQSFTRTLQRKGRGRITVTSVVLYDGHTAGRLEGEFVALGG